MTPAIIQHKPQPAQYKQYGESSDFNEDNMIKSTFTHSGPESSEVDNF